MKTRMLTPNPPKHNPFHHDFSNMGTKVAANIMIMHPTHDDQPGKYIIIVNTDTGERLEVTF